LDSKDYRLIEEYVGKLNINRDVVFNEIVIKDFSTKFNKRRPKIEWDSSINIELENVNEMGVEESSR
jgi:hypothetical protein